MYRESNLRWKKSGRRLLALILSAATAFTLFPSLPASTAEPVWAAIDADKTIKLSPGDHSVFNDMDGDGLGEFQGFGTSLCWWANRVGYSDSLAEQAAEAFYNPSTGLGMTIGRYNVGGGDNVGEMPKVTPNDKAVIYDLSVANGGSGNPSYGANNTGSKMSVSQETSFATATYTKADPDFGFSSGDTIGNFNYIGWISRIGESSADADNLHYTVNAKESATYTVKLLLMLAGTNERGMAARVYDGSNYQDYSVDAATINNNLVASGSKGLYVATLTNVALKAGENRIDIGGSNDYAMDFIKMAVIKTGEEGKLPETTPFLHAPHITRSDSAVPGYATDVTKIDKETYTKETYKEAYKDFARADWDCGYAWNYDWVADKNQMNVVQHIIDKIGEDAIIEAFSNSPPYFMTNSGCSSGNVNASEDNLRADSYTAFAWYMADVIEYWTNHGVHFQSVTPMNEPYTNFWPAYSYKQEGCHFDIGESESKILVELNKELQKKGIAIIQSAADETNIDTAIASYKALSAEAKEAITRIDTHSYSGSNRTGLRALAEEAGENLWMSEVDGSFTGGQNSGEMSCGLGMANYIRLDLNGMMPSAWILWNAIDNHIDSNDERDTFTRDMMAGFDTVSNGDASWGIAVADHDTQEVLLTKKYYAFGQFSRYIRPGYTIFASSDDTVAAYSASEHKVAIVAINMTSEDQTWAYDFSDFEEMSDKVTAIRTSGTLKDGENWADVSASDDIVVQAAEKQMAATAKANSITTYIVEGVDYDSSEEVILSAEPASAYSFAGIPAVLPATVSVTTSKRNVKDVKVTWNLKDVDLTKEGTVKGQIEGSDIEAEARISVLGEDETNLQYFIDCNNASSLDYKAVDAYARLKNEVPDQKYDGTWGYVEDDVAYGMYNEDGDNVYATGYYVKAPITYKLPLEKGSYKFTFYFKEWWTRWHASRPITVNISASGAQEVTGKADTWKDGESQGAYTYGFTMPSDGEVTVTVTGDEGEALLAGLRVQKLLDLTGIQAAITRANSEDLTDYSARKKALLQKMLGEAADLMLKSSTQQYELDEKAEAIHAFIDAGANGITEADIAENDYILYLVDVGSSDTTMVPDDYKLGLYQSVTDQAYGEDAQTGYKWGYGPDDENSKRMPSGTADGTLTGNYIYMSDEVTYVKNKSGFTYTFDLPERASQDYEVIVGVKSPWSARTMDVVLEGETVSDAMAVPQGTLAESINTITVTDNELNVFIHNPDRTSQYVDPVLSYIIVKAVPAYDVSFLRDALKEYNELAAGKEYLEATKQAYDAAVTAARAVIDNADRTQEDIKNAYEALKKAFEGLVELHKETYTSITGTAGERMYDNNGLKIQAHGGQVSKFTVDGVTKYYWYGEDKTYGMDPVTGIHLYTSTDLYNWTDEGVALRAVPEVAANTAVMESEDYSADQLDLSIFEEDDYFSMYSSYKNEEPQDKVHYQTRLEELYWNMADNMTIMERPKVLYNDKTGKYVMWFHNDGAMPGSKRGYSKARAGVAISDSPQGPFKYVGSYKLNYDETVDHSWDNDGGEGSVRDMTLFKDDDGTGYIIYSSDGNANMYISRLNDAFTNVAGVDENGTPLTDKDAADADGKPYFSINFIGAMREAPAMFKYNNKYYMINSGCTGWSPNQASYAVADAPLGPWTTVGDPCTDDGASTTYDTQSTWVIPVDEEQGKYIYMGDRWFNPDIGNDLSDSRYVWIPIEFLPGDRIALKKYENWTLDELEGKGAYKILTEIPETISDASELPTALTIQATDGTTSEVTAQWDADSIVAVGNAQVNGMLSNGKDIAVNVNVIPKKLYYFFDCAGDKQDAPAAFFTKVKEALGSQLQNEASDQVFTEENKAGFAGTYMVADKDGNDVGIKNGGSDIWSHGYWAGDSNTIDYAFVLPAGEYTAAAGFHEWWNTARATRITVKTDDETLGTKDFTLGKADSARVETVGFTLPAEAKVTVSISKTGSAAPVLSTIAIIKNDLVIEEKKDDEKKDDEKKDDEKKDDEKKEDTPKSDVPYIEPGSGAAVNTGTDSGKNTGEAAGDKTTQGAPKPGMTVDCTVTKTEKEDGFTVEHTEIPALSQNASASVTVKTDVVGSVVSSKATVRTKASEDEALLSGDMLSNLETASGQDNVEITMIVDDADGNRLYRVKVDSKDLVPGNELYAYRLLNTGEYVMVGKKSCKVGDGGSIALEGTEQVVYRLVTEEAAKTIDASIEKTVKLAKKAVSLKKGKKASIPFAKKFDMRNAKSVSYSSKKTAIVSVSKTGRLKAKKAGTTTIIIKVTLKNGTKKTLKYKVTVK